MAVNSEALAGRVSRTGREWALLAIEVISLAAAVRVPLAIAPEGSMVGWVTAPKAFAFRTLALAMVVALAALWALDGAGGLRRIARGPGRWVLLGVGAFALANVVATALSPVPAVSVWGVDVTRDAYGLFAVSGYLVLLAGAGVYVRSRAHVLRLLAALAVVSALVGAYAIAQRFGVDPVRLDPQAVTRTPSFLGNPIFTGSLLVMTIPLLLAGVLMLRHRMSPAVHLWAGGAVLALPMSALVLALSRGPWLGMIAGFAAFAVALWLAGLKAQVLRAGAMVVLALAPVLLLVALTALDD